MIFASERERERKDFNDWDHFLYAEEKDKIMEKNAARISFLKKRKKETGSYANQSRMRLFHFLDMALSGLFRPFRWYLIRFYTVSEAPYVESKHYHT